MVFDKLTSCQKRKAKKILANLYDDSIKYFWYSAPTGAGKTFTIANVLKQYFIENPSNKILVIFGSLSTAGLYNQSYNDFKKYNENYFFNYLNIKKIDSPSIDKKNLKKHDINYSSLITPITENHEIYFIGSASYRKKTILHDKKIFKKYLDNAINKKYKILYIRDEAHIGTNTDKYDINIPRKSLVSLENLLDEEKYKDFIIKKIYLSATPNKESKNDVIMTEREAIDDNLIKRINEQNFYFQEITDEITEKDQFDLMIESFLNLKKAYKEESNPDDVIKPALLIQISSEKNYKKSSEDDKDITSATEQVINKITRELSKPSINLNWFVWLANLKNSNIKTYKNIPNEIAREELSKNTSPIDVIIFKVALATGWNIPRAAMLYQNRKINSTKLNIQTIGRIRRNPILLNKKYGSFSNSIFDNYYIYSTYGEPLNKEDYKTVKLKEKYLKENIYITTQRQIRYSVDKEKFKNLFIDYFKKNICLFNKEIHEFQTTIKDSLESKQIDRIKQDHYGNIDKKKAIIMDSTRAFKSEPTKNIIVFLIYLINKANSKDYIKKTYDEILRNNFFKNNRANLFYEIINNNEFCNHLQNMQYNSTSWDYDNYKNNPVKILKKVKLSKSALVYSRESKSNGIETLWDFLKDHTYKINTQNNDRSSGLRYMRKSQNISKSWTKLYDFWIYDETLRGDEIWKIYMESDSEYIFLKLLIDLLFEKTNDLSFFGKNYLNRNINYSYILESEGNKKQANSNPDFIIKFKNKYLICEIKNYYSYKDDARYNEKCKSIENGYLENSKALKKKQYKFAVIYMAPKDKTIKKGLMFSSGKCFKVNDIKSLFESLQKL